MIRNLSDCSSKVKTQAYLTTVRPQMQYALAVWDPYYNVDVEKCSHVARCGSLVITTELAL